MTATDDRYRNNVGGGDSDQWRCGSKPDGGYRGVVNTGIPTYGALRLAATTIGRPERERRRQLANAASGASTADLAVTDGAGAITFSQTGGPLSVNARTSGWLDRGDERRRYTDGRTR